MSHYDSNTPPPVSSSGDDNTLALLVHLSGIVFGFLVPLIVWLVNKDNPNKAFLNDQSKEALNFQITVFIAYFVAGVLCVVLIGFLLLPLIWLANVVLCILAGLAAQKGEYYRYPFALRLIK